MFRRAINENGRRGVNDLRCAEDGGINKAGIRAAMPSIRRRLLRGIDQNQNGVAGYPV